MQSEDGKVTTFNFYPEDINPMQVSFHCLFIVYSFSFFHFSQIVCLSLNSIKLLLLTK